MSSADLFQIANDMPIDKVEEMALTDLRRPSFMPQDLEAVKKSGELHLRDSNTVKKYLFKNWKPYRATLEPGRLVVYKSGEVEKVKAEYLLSQSYVTYAFFGEPEERLTAVYYRSAKGAEEIFKAPTKDEAKDWVLAMKTNSKILDNTLVLTLKFPNPPGEFEEKVLKMGWVREKTPIHMWRWRYMLLTDYAIYLYDKPPTSAQLSNFTTKYVLSEVKQKEVDPNSFAEAEEEGIKFAFAILAQKESSFICTETKNEHKNWQNAIKSMAMLAIKKIESFPFAVWLPGEDQSAPPSTLTIRRANGFTLKKPSGEESWNRPLKHFKQFKVDKKTILLDFGKYAEAPIELVCEQATTISIVISLVVESFLDPSKLMA